MPAPTPSAYHGRDFNPRAISIRMEYSSSLGMTLGPGDGALTISPRATNGIQKLPVKDRGAFDGHNEGEYVPDELAVTVRSLNETLTSSVAARVRDFMDKAGTFSGATDLGDVPGTFRVIITYADKSTVTYALCEGEYGEAHAFPSNTIAFTLRNHSTRTVANL